MSLVGSSLVYKSRISALLTSLHVHVWSTMMLLLAGISTVWVRTTRLGELLLVMMLGIVPA